MLLVGAAVAVLATASIESAEQERQPEQPPLSRSFHAAAVVNGKIYVMGGRSPAPGGGALDKNVTFPAIEVYAPAQ